MARFVPHSSFTASSGMRISTPNFCALAECPAHESHSRDAGREAEVILDPGRAPLVLRRNGNRARGRTGLPNLRRRMSPIRGAGADDYDVIELVAVHGPDGPTQRLAGPRSDCEEACPTDRARSGAARDDVEAIDQRLRAAVRRRVQLPVGMTIAAQEIGKPQHVPHWHRRQ